MPHLFVFDDRIANPILEWKFMTERADMVSYWCCHKVGGADDDIDLWWPVKRSES